MSSLRNHTGALEWIEWCAAFPVELNRHAADRDGMEADVAESIMINSVIEACQQIIMRKENLRTIFFTKLECGQDCDMHNGQYWLDHFIQYHSGAIIGVKYFEFELAGQIVTGPPMLCIQGGYAALNAGMAVNLPVAAWTSTPAQVAAYRYIAERLDRWLKENLSALKRELVSTGGTQIAMF